MRPLAFAPPPPPPPPRVPPPPPPGGGVVVSPLPPPPPPALRAVPLPASRGGLSLLLPRRRPAARPVGVADPLEVHLKDLAGRLALHHVFADLAPGPVLDHRRVANAGVRPGRRRPDVAIGRHGQR